MMARGSSTHHCRRTLSCSSLVPNCSPCWKSPSITALSKRLYVHACTVSRCSHDDGEGKGSSESNSVAASTTLLRCLLTHLAVSRSWAGSEFPIFFLGITSPYTLGTNQHVTLLEISFNHSAQQAPIRACMYGLEVFRRRWRGQRLE